MNAGGEIVVSYHVKTAGVLVKFNGDRQVILRDSEMSDNSPEMRALGALIEEFGVDIDATKSIQHPTCEKVFTDLEKVKNDV